MPRTIANRYDQGFWLRKANEVLSDMEKIGEIPRTKMTDGLVLEDGVTSYKIKNFMSKILNIYDNEGSLLPFSREGLWLEFVSSSVVGSTLIVDSLYVDQNDTSQLISNLVPGFIPDSSKKYFVLATGGPNTGRCIPVQKISISSITGYLETRLYRDFLYKDSGANYSIYEHAYYIEYASKFTNALDVTTAIVEDEDIPEVLEAGLRYYGELQTEEEGEFVNRSFQEYKRKIKDWYKRHQREANLTSRYMPGF